MLIALLVSHLNPRISRTTKRKWWHELILYTWIDRTKKNMATCTFNHNSLRVINIVSYSFKKMNFVWEGSSWLNEKDWSNKELVGRKLLLILYPCQDDKQHLAVIWADLRWQALWLNVQTPSFSVSSIDMRLITG